MKPFQRHLISLHTACTREWGRHKDAFLLLLPSSIASYLYNRSNPALGSNIAKITVALYQAICSVLLTNHWPGALKMSST
jgi:hypothetical protein